MHPGFPKMHPGVSPLVGDVYYKFRGFLISPLVEAISGMWTPPAVMQTLPIPPSPELMHIRTGMRVYAVSDLNTIHPGSTGERQHAVSDLNASWFDR